jgi:hypothetical protein
MSHLRVKDLKDPISDGVHICTRPNDHFTLELKDSPWWIVGGGFIMLFGFREP